MLLTSLGRELGVWGLEGDGALSLQRAADILGVWRGEVREACGRLALLLWVFSELLFTGPKFCVLTAAPCLKP